MKEEYEINKEQSINYVKEAIKSLNLAIEAAGKHNLRVSTKQEWHPMSNAAAPDRSINPPVSASITEMIEY